MVDEATPVAKDGHVFVLERYPKRFRVFDVDEPTSTKWLCEVQLNLDSNVSSMTFTIQRDVYLFDGAQYSSYGLCVLLSHALEWEIMDLYPKGCIGERCVVDRFVVTGLV